MYKIPCLPNDRVFYCDVEINTLQYFLTNAHPALIIFLSLSGIVYTEGVMIFGTH